VTSENLLSDFVNPVNTWAENYQLTCLRGQSYLPKPSSAHKDISEAIQPQKELICAV